MGNAPLEWKDIAFSITGNPDVDDASVREMMADMYSRLSIRKMARTLGISCESVRSKLRELGFYKPQDAGMASDP